MAPACSLEKQVLVNLFSLFCPPLPKMAYVTPGPSAAEADMGGERRGGGTLPTQLRQTTSEIFWDDSGASC